MRKKLIDLAQKIKNYIPAHITISTAESCTGGMLSSYLTNISGSSEYFLGGVVSYSNEVKVKLLSVSPNTLDKFGAVSEETAREMALGSKKATGSNIAISITGIAGPGGGNKEKPVGTVCFAIVNDLGARSITQYFQGSREEIRKKSCLTALELILDEIQKKNYHNGALDWI